MNTTPREGSLYLVLYDTAPAFLSIRDHKNKASRSSKFSKDNGEFKLVYQENYPTQLEAMRREKQLKGWIRAKKEALISGNLELLKRL